MWWQRNIDRYWTVYANNRLHIYLYIAAAFISPEVLAIVLFILPWVRNFIETSNWKILHILTWWFQVFAIFSWLVLVPFSCWVILSTALGCWLRCWLYIILRAIEIHLCQIEYNLLLWVTFKAQPERDLSNRRGLSPYKCVILTWQHHCSRYLLSNKCSKYLRSSLWSSLVEIV